MTTIINETTVENTHTVSTQMQERRILNSALKAGRFILHLVEMTLAMMAGMVVLYLLDVLSPESSSLAPFFEYGTIEFDLAMAVFMTVPMTAWMLVRHHDRRHVAEMSFGMNAPVAMIIVLRLLGVEAYQPWLAEASHPAMFLGMIVAMLAQRDHYTGKAGHSTHTAQHHTH